MNGTREKDERGRETVRGGWITDFPDKGKQNGDAGQAMQRTPKKFPLPHNLPVSNLLPFTFFHRLSASLSSSRFAVLSRILCIWFYTRSLERTTLNGHTFYAKNRRHSTSTFTSARSNIEGPSFIPLKLTRREILWGNFFFLFLFFYLTLSVRCYCLLIDRCGKGRIYIQRKVTQTIEQLYQKNARPIESRKRNIGWRTMKPRIRSYQICSFHHLNSLYTSFFVLL